MPRVLRRRSSSATAWCATSFLAKITAALGASRQACAPGRRRSGLVTVQRSVILGCGSYLPSADPHQQRSGAQGRHLRRLDRAAHRHPRAPHRGARRIDLAHGDACGARRARPCQGRCPVDRSDRAGDLDARQHLSGERRGGAGRARHHPWRRLRPAGGVLRLRLRAGDGRRLLKSGAFSAGAGDRRGDVFAHSRLDRPQHLRAVRRRRRRRRARRARLQPGPRARIAAS